MIEIFLDPALLTDFLRTTLRLSVPLVFAAVGGVISERSGVYNIALEGIMLGGAFGAAVGAFLFEDAFAGLAFGIGTGMLAASILAVLGVLLGVNQIVTGIAINLLVVGLTAFLSRVVFGAQANTLKLDGFRQIDIPMLSEIPVVGPVLFGQDFLVYAMYAIVPIAYALLFHSSWGLKVRAVGENPRAADTAGISVNRTRVTCVLISGALAGMAGCHLVLSQVFLFSENMSAGKGFIALAAVILGRWNPVGALMACVLFGFFDALQLRLQFMNPEIPFQIFVALPYVVSILALIGIVGRPQPPAAAGSHYRREAR